MSNVWSPSFDSAAINVLPSFPGSIVATDKSSIFPLTPKTKRCSSASVQNLIGRSIDGGSGARFGGAVVLHAKQRAD